MAAAVVRELKTTGQAIVQGSDGRATFSNDGVTVEWTGSPTTQEEVERCKKAVQSIMHELGLGDHVVARYGGNLHARAWSAGLLPRAQSHGGRRRRKTTATVRFRPACPTPWTRKPEMLVPVQEFLVGSGVIDSRYMMHEELLKSQQHLIPRSVVKRELLAIIEDERQKQAIPALALSGELLEDDVGNGDVDEKKVIEPAVDEKTARELEERAKQLAADESTYATVQYAGRINFVSID